MKTFIIDAHMIGLFRDCEEKYNRRINQLLSPKKPSAALAAGIVFHSALAHFRLMRKSGASLEESFNGGLYILRQDYAKEMPPEFCSQDLMVVCPDERRTLPNLERIFEGYIKYEERQHYEYEHIEQPMSVSLGTVHVAGEDYEIIYVGIIDSVIKHQGLIYVEDFKSTGMNITQSYKDGFRLSQAIKGYYFGMRETLATVPFGALIDISWIQKEPKSGRAKPLEEYFHTVPLTFTSGQIDEWYKNTLLTVRKMIEAESEGTYQLSFGSSCNNYSGCMFREVCWSDPMSRQMVIDMDFERRTWEPLSEIRSEKVSEEDYKKWLVRESIHADTE